MRESSRQRRALSEPTLASGVPGLVAMSGSPGLRRGQGRRENLTATRAATTALMSEVMPIPATVASGCPELLAAPIQHISPTASAARPEMALHVKASRIWPSSLHEIHGCDSYN